MIQELQLTTNGNNIEALEVDGTFDDCQAMVKQAFLDEELNRKYNLTSANSINISRLIPQMFYYANTYARLKDRFQELTFVTPSGNFGNIAAGMMANTMGVPVKAFIAATNSNDIVPQYLQTGVYTARPSVQTLANAMDVGDPSNFVRILDLYENDKAKLEQQFSAIAFNDQQIKEAIKEVYQEKGYVMCPHTATGYLAVKAMAERTDSAHAYVILSTAHPCKFPDVFEELNIPYDIPEEVKSLYHKERKQIPMSNSFEDFKRFLLND